MKKTFLIGAMGLIAGLSLTACVVVAESPEPTATHTPSVVREQPTEPTNIEIGRYKWNGLDITMTQTGYGYATNKQLANWGIKEASSSGSVDDQKELDYSERVLAVKFTVTNNTDRELILVGLGLANTRWIVEDTSSQMVNNNIWMMDHNSDSFHEQLGLSTLPADGWLLAPGGTKELNLDIYVPPIVAELAKTSPDNKIEIINVFFLPSADNEDGEFSPEYKGYVSLSETN